MEKPSQLHVSLLQLDLVWQDKEANKRNIEALFEQLPNPTHVVVLPEMFTTGFTMDPGPYAEPANGPTAVWLQSLAQKYNVNIMGSHIVEENQAYYNRLTVTYPNGKQEKYDKRHLFRFGDEHNHYNAGTQRLEVEILGWKILPLICYDLRFPVWSRNSFENPYDIIIYVANWPAARAHVWNTLLEARALENVCFVVGTNRIGIDGRSLAYQGDSKAIDFKGNNILEAAEKPGVFSTILDCTDLQDFRKKFNTLLDGDKFQIIL